MKKIKKIKKWFPLGNHRAFLQEMPNSKLTHSWRAGQCYVCGCAPLVGAQFDEGNTILEREYCPNCLDAFSQRRLKAVIKLKKEEK
jgi:hypothetical protein